MATENEQPIRISAAPAPVPYRVAQMSLQLLIYSAVMVIMVTGFAVWSSGLMNSSVRDFNRTSAFEVAEAGIEYCRWHLAHAQTDYQDGTGHAGPYVHDYTDKDGTVIGTFTLDITPPSTGSTIVTIRSTGKLANDASVQKIIEVRMGIPSMAQYAVAMNADVRFGTGTEVFGPIRSSGGIRFDGLAHNLVSSAVTTTTDPDPPYDYAWGVHTHVVPTDAAPPTPLASRPDIFMSGRKVGVPDLNFAGITQSLSDIRVAASSSGFYRSSSTAKGYEVVFKPDSTFDLRRVAALMSPPPGCTGTQDKWGTWSIQSSTLLGTYAIPANGLIFLEDNVWVRGQVSSTRAVVAAGAFPDTSSTWASITVNRDLQYTNYDGRDVLGLIAQYNVNVGLNSSDTLRIDAAMIAQNGRAGRYYYASNCGESYKRTSLTLYGMIASAQRYGFAYTDGTGYQTRNIVYDSSLFYGPPPSFPLVGNQYVQLSWDEVQ